MPEDIQECFTELASKFDESTEGFTTEDKFIYGIQMQLLFVSRIAGVVANTGTISEAFKLGNIWTTIFACHQYIGRLRKEIELTDIAELQWQHITRHIDDLDGTNAQQISIISESLYFHLGYLACEVALRKS